MKRQAYATASKDALYKKFFEYLQSHSRGQGRNMIEKLKKLVAQKQQPAPKPAFKPRPKGTYNLQQKSFIFRSRFLSR